MKTTLENKFRFTTMPIPSVDYADGKPYQYIGTTTTTEPIYTNGYFYKCVAQGTDPETYAWEAQPVQEGGGSGRDKEDKFRYSNMPELSAENNGKIYQYIGQTNADFKEGYSYKSDYWIKEYIGDVSNFEGTGDSRNYTISIDEIDLQTVQTGESYVKCLVPIENKGTLKITKTRISGNRLNFLYTELGTTVGSDDLYVSETWDSIAEGDTVVEEIDLSQYNASEIYLSFHIMVASGNNSYFKVSSIEQSYRQWKEEEVSQQPQKFTSAEMTEIKNAVSQETVNVNIIPYHIYDTDEHVVGEWRQIVDGVKKKKPVYEKKIAYTQDYETPLTWQTIADKSTEERLIKCYLETSIGCVYVYTALVEGKIKMNYAQAVYGNQFVVIQYTKTTDSWENV